MENEARVIEETTFTNKSGYGKIQLTQKSETRYTVRTVADLEEWPYKLDVEQNTDNIESAKFWYADHVAKAKNT